MNKDTTPAQADRRPFGLTDEQWRDLSPAALRRYNTALRRARLAAARHLGTHTTAEWDWLLEACGRVCLQCGQPGPLERDHIQPLYQGGGDGIANIQPLCRSCNARKGPDSADLRPRSVRQALGLI